MTETREIISPEMLLQAYASGIFPMAESRNDPELFWVDPQQRGVLPLDGFHISRSLARKIRKGDFKATLNHDFEGVLDACANREDTWISDQIRSLYLSLFKMGHAHSLEIWEEDTLAGGVYGVALGGAFFGESMFSERTDGSKLALAHLVSHLKRCSFVLFDTQFLTSHLASLGAVEIPRKIYRALLAEAITIEADLNSKPLVRAEA